MQMKQDRPTKGVLLAATALLLAGLTGCGKEGDPASDRSTAAAGQSADTTVDQQTTATGGADVGEAMGAERADADVVGGSGAMPSEHERVRAEHEQMRLRAEHEQMRREHAGSGMTGSAQSGAGGSTQPSSGGAMSDDQMPMGGQSGMSGGMMGMDDDKMGKSQGKMGSDKAMPMEADKMHDDHM